MVMPLPVPRLTIDMLDDFPDDGTRYELLEGMLLVTPAPSFAHQLVATRLATTLTNALPGTGAAYLALGVQEYWIVDPGDCSVEKWSPERSEGLRVTEKLVWRPAALDREIVIDLRALFDEVCDDAD
jgi:Uma2 family endonuclease